MKDYVLWEIIKVWSGGGGGVCGGGGGGGGGGGVIHYEVSRFQSQGMNLV